MTDKVKDGGDVDLALLGPKTPAGHKVMRIKGDKEGPKEIVLGEIRPVKEGEPILGDVVRLDRKGDSNVFGVETILENPMKPEPQSGGRRPPMVSSEAYREGWERVFGNKPPKADDTVN